MEAQQLRSLEPPAFTSALNHAIEILAASRPTAVNLFWALKRMRVKWDSLKANSPGEIADVLLEEAHEVLAEDIRINRKIGAFGAELLADGARVLTHCNAGALATRSRDALRRSRLRSASRKSWVRRPVNTSVTKFVFKIDSNRAPPSS